MAIKDLLSAQECIWPHVGYAGYLEETVSGESCGVITLSLCTRYHSILCDKMPGKANYQYRRRTDFGPWFKRVQSIHHSRGGRSKLLPLLPSGKGQRALIDDASLPPLLIQSWMCEMRPPTFRAGHWSVSNLTEVLTSIVWMAQDQVCLSW